MLSAIAFAIKMIVAAAFVVALSLGRGESMPRERVGFYALLSVAMAAVTAVSQELGSGLLVGAVFAVIGLISYNQFRKQGELFDTLQSITPLWIVTVTGMCAGAGMLLQGAFLTFLAYYILNYFPSLLGYDRKSEA
ncbi:MAG: hypothetical protein CMG71_06645 [Candidatus Marinimicrobia bacterium]|nr:hypothetical protein [Candidatus Neomarinimicrobiota bacterium]|tara:strand:- start:22485 stop:22892 length:408 start_codon:yes stop_codon:yes gene_type:complete